MNLSHWNLAVVPYGLFATKLSKIWYFFEKIKVVQNCFSMFFQLDPSFEGSKSKICHQDLTLRKIHSLLNHQGYGLMCPVRDTCKWAWRWEEMDNWYCYHYTTLLVDIVMRKYSGEMPNFSPNTNIFHFSTKIDKYTKILTSVIE